MKIVIATPLFPPELGIPAMYVYTLAKQLSKEHKVTVVTYANHTEKIEGVRIKKIAKSSSLFVRLFNYTKALHRTALHADVIYAQRGGASGLPAIIVGWLTKTPVVVNYIEDEAWEKRYHLFPEEHQGRFRQIQKIPGEIWGIWHAQHFVLKRAQAIVAPSKYLCDELVRTHALLKENVHTIYTPTHTPLALPFTKKDHTHKTIFVNTPLLTWKDVATAIRTTALLVQKYPDIELILAGDGPEKIALQELTEDKGVEKNVTFLGKISKAEALFHLRNSDVFLCPCMYEDKLNILHSPIQEKIPIAVTDIPGLRELLIDGENACIVPPGNAKECATILSNLFEDEMLQKRITEGAHEMLQNEFSWKVHTEKLLSLFKKFSAV